MTLENEREMWDDIVAQAARPAGTTRWHRTQEAQDFAASYTGSFGFLVAMREKVEAGTPLSEKMVEAILRCKAREEKRDFDELQRFANPVDEPVTEPGMYERGGVIFRVQRSKESGKLYAKKLVPIGGQRMLDSSEEVVHFEFEYDRGAIFTLRADQRMTLEEAQAFGIRYGVCCVCGARLKDAESVARGIGPVCGGRV